MNIQHSDLSQRLEDFSLDELDADFPFGQRLAKENRWSLDYARRVIDEYKKFAFLAVRAGHPVSPSEPIDQVWHLHLTYTQSYWGEFCPQVLQMPFHHQPTRGGQEEQQKFQDWYLKTLESYQHWFGESPPTDIWKPPHLHLRQRDKFVRVNARKNWIVPKPLVLVPVVLALNGTVAGYQATSNPLNFKGPEFLFFYSLVLMAALVVAWILRFLLRQPFNSSSADKATLDPYEVAYLSKGKKQAVDAAIASLVQRQVVELAAETRSLEVRTPVPELSHPLEQEVASAIAERGYIDSVRSSPFTATQPIRDRLQELNLLVSWQQAFWAQLIPALTLFAVLLLGLSKIAVGIAREKPISFLGVLCILTVGIAIAFLVIPVHRSRYGDRILSQLETQHRDLQQSPDDAQLVLAFALFGSTVLTQETWQDLYRVLTPPPPANSSFSSGCGGGCGSCGGGCGGCGGCGG